MFEKVNGTAVIKIIKKMKYNTPKTEVLEFSTQECVLGPIPMPGSGEGPEPK